RSGTPATIRSRRSPWTTRSTRWPRTAAPGGPGPRLPPRSPRAIWPAGSLLVCPCRKPRPSRSMAAVTLGRGGAGPGHAQPGRGHAAADRAARLGASFEQARAGDQAAMREVVAQLNPLLWRVAKAQGLAAEEAADVVQTSW